MYRISSITLYIVSAAFGFVLIACGSDNPVNSATTASNSVSPTITPLARGSSITIMTHQTDSNGVTSPMSNETVKIVAPLFRYSGMEDVVELNTSNGSAYLHFDPNGDVWSLDASATWQRFPFSGQDMPEAIRREQVNGSEKDVVTETITYIGEKQITIGGETFTQRGIQDVITMEHYTGTNVKDGTRVKRGQMTTTIYFIPAIGYFGEITSITTELDSRGNVKRQLSRLESVPTTIVRR